MKIYRAGAVLLVFLLLLTGCGSGSGDDSSGGGSGGSTQASNTEAEGLLPGPGGRTQESKGVSTVYVAMDGWDSAETVSIIEAEHRGFFEKADLAVITLSPVTSKLTIPDVVKGQDSIGVAHGPEAIEALDRGAPIVIIGNVLERSTAAFIWDKSSGISGIADLKGKTVAIPGLAFQEDFLEKALEEEGLSPSEVKVISVGNDLVPALVKGRADAIFGGSENVEGIDLKARGFEPVVTPVGEFGVPDYDELVLVARRDIAEANPELMSDFVSATAHGASEAAKNPKEAAAALAATGESNPEISPKTKQVQVRATLGELSASGSVDPARLQGLIDWMYENEMIEAEHSAQELLP